MREVFDLRPGGDRARPRPEAADLPGDRGLRPLRPRAGFSWEDTTRLDDFKAAVGALKPPAANAIDRALIARVLPDVTGLDKEFDYLVPDDTRRDRGGRRRCVRVDLHGRRVGGWVVELRPADGGRRRPAAPTAQADREGHRRGPVGRPDRARRVGVRALGGGGGCARSSSRRLARTGRRRAAAARHGPRRGTVEPTLARRRPRMLEGGGGVLRLPPRRTRRPALPAVVQRAAGSGRIARRSSRRRPGAARSRPALRRAGLTVAVVPTGVGARRRRASTW